MPLRLLEQTRRFAQLSTATVFDVLDVLGLPGQALCARIRPLALGMKVAGPAFTARGTVQRSQKRSFRPTLSYEAFRAMFKGCVLVLEAGEDSPAGLWGENTSLGAKQRGCVGAVIDGGARDADTIIEMGFPVFARFASAVRGHGRWVCKDWGKPVQLAGQLTPRVTIHPGDIILGDSDGVVCVPAALADYVLAAAEAAQEVELRMREALRQGKDREAVDAEFDRWTYVKQHLPPVTGMAAHNSRRKSRC